MELPQGDRRSASTRSGRRLRPNSVARQHEVADHDDLIQLGLNSIRMMALAGGWRKHGAGITFAELAASPTVESWHGLLCAGEAEEMPSAADRAGAEQPNREPVAEEAPFPLATMQHAYWIGRSDEQELGGVAAHLYVEFDGGNLDPDRLKTRGVRSGRGASDAAHPIPSRRDATNNAAAR